MSITQKEIADKLNVSQSQVARALSGAGGVSEATRSLIESAAREMGYDSNANTAARLMAGKRHGQKTKNGLIAVMYCQPEASTPRNLPFYGPVFDGMERAAGELDLEICTCRTTLHTLPRLIKERKVDGVITLGHLEQHVEGVKSLGMPIVLFHGFSSITHCAAADDYDGARQATEHLLQLGHRRIAYLGVVDFPGLPGKVRLQGYLDAMRDFGLSTDDFWVNDSLRAPASTADAYCQGCEECAACIGWRTMKEQSDFEPGTGELPFTAIVCHNDAAAMGFISKAMEDGYRVPEDFSVVAFDNISQSYRFSPRVTSIDPALNELGESTVRLVHRLLQAADEGKSTTEAPFEHPLFPVKLAIHESTRPVMAGETSRGRILQSTISG